MIERVFVLAVGVQPECTTEKKEQEERQGLCSSGRSGEQCTDVLLYREQMEHVVFNFYLLISVVVEVPTLPLLSHLDKLNTFSLS